MVPPWGHQIIGVNVVAQILNLIQPEAVRLDADVLDSLFSQIGTRAGDEILCRAVEQLARRLSLCHAQWDQQEWIDLRKGARSIIAISEQVGMSTLAGVAGDVVVALDGGDGVAVDATLYRLMRIGERSLAAAWDLRDISLGPC